MDVKRKTLAEGGDGLIGFQDNAARGHDRFVVREWETPDKNIYLSKY